MKRSTIACEPKSYCAVNSGGCSGVPEPLAEYWPAPAALTALTCAKYLVPAVRPVMVLVVDVLVVLIQLDADAALWRTL